MTRHYAAPARSNHQVTGAQFRYPPERIDAAPVSWLLDPGLSHTT